MDVFGLIVSVLLILIACGIAGVMFLSWLHRFLKRQFRS